MPSIRDLARATGLSTGTVSQALTGRGVVRESTRARVVAAAQALGYDAAPHLARHAARSVVLLMRVAEDQDPFAGFLYRIVSSALAEAEASRLSVTIRKVTSDEVLTSHLRKLALDRTHAGVVVCSMCTLPAGVAGAMRSLVEAGVPVVSLGEAVAGVTSSVIDNAEAEGMAVEYLVGLGHRSLLYVGPDDPPRDGHERRAGYESACARHGIAPCTATEVGACDVGSHTGVLCFDDHAALRAVLALRGRGLRVPQDVSVMGFGRLSDVMPILPDLATVGHPVEEHAGEAMRLLAGKLSGKAKYEVRVAFSCAIVPGATAMLRPKTE